MKRIVLIGTGGFFGAILRYCIKNMNIYNGRSGMPLNTLLINISGTFVLALLLTIAFEIWEFDEAVRLGLATGFLGAFTTFSTMCKETIQLIAMGHYYTAVYYLLMSVVIGFSAAYLGVIVAREVIARIIRQEDELDVLE